MLAALFCISLLMIIAIAIIPVARFLLYQWNIRRQEIQNRLEGDTLPVYLKRFHSEAGTPTAADQEAQFLAMYNRSAGRHLYLVPAALLVVTVALLGGLVIATAIRSGYEQYLVFYQSWLSAEGKMGEQVPLAHLTIAELDAAVLPFSSIALSLTALAAISGAYLYVIGVVIQGFRARTLLSSDLLWCSFRMVIAVPLGLSLGLLASTALGPFVAFALGAFPIEAINRILRRLLNKTLDLSEAEKADQLINLLGVTTDVSAALTGEGISAVQQIASMDPVALAIRTGLPFDYVIDLAAQSQSWCYLGAKVTALAELGLGDARMIADLSRRLDLVPADDEAAKVLGAAAKAAGLEEAVLRTAFRGIAADPYTLFLMQVAR